MLTNRDYAFTNCTSPARCVHWHWRACVSQRDSKHIYNNEDDDKNVSPHWYTTFKDIRQKQQACGRFHYISQTISFVRHCKHKTTRLPLKLSQMSYLPQNHDGNTSGHSLAHKYTYTAQSQWMNSTDNARQNSIHVLNRRHGITRLEKKQLTEQAQLRCNYVSICNKSTGHCAGRFSKNGIHCKNAINASQNHN